MTDPWPFTPLQRFGYGMIVADPPWRFETYSDRGHAKAPQGKYECMSLDAIKALPVMELAAGDAVLWLWATHPMLPAAIDVMKAWGFRFVTSGVWLKRTRHGKIAFGTGYRLRCGSEPFLIGVTGNPETPRNIRTAFEGPVREHSRKPDEAYAIAEHMTPPGAFRLDLFARQRRPGWESWGDQTDKFTEGES